MRILLQRCPDTVERDRIDTKARDRSHGRSLLPVMCSVSYLDHYTTFRGACLPPLF